MVAYRRHALNDGFSSPGLASKEMSSDIFTVLSANKDSCAVPDVNWLVYIN